MKEDSDLIEKLIKRIKELALAYFELINLKTIDMHMAMHIRDLDTQVEKTMLMN